ncbi:MAG: hypothetical protein HYZ26_03430 [Chloroflexi bacterium]|nr:hypothetical protein [Chloroflexota bacterium]
MHRRENQPERGWRSKLQAWGLEDVAASLLEATGPLHLAAAQLVYLGQPLLAGLVPEDRLNALARLLEDPQETRALAQTLREGPE